MPPAALKAPEDFRWSSVDGQEIQGWLYRPDGDAKGLVVQIHGGPTAHSEDALSAFIQSCVAAGFAVLDPNYRGSTGFGLAFREAIRADGWGGREQDDIRTGAEAVIARGLAPRGKVAVTGTSYGGYSSWCAVTRWPADLLAAAAPICGMTDLVIDYDFDAPGSAPLQRGNARRQPRAVSRALPRALADPFRRPDHRQTAHCPGHERSQCHAGEPAFGRDGADAGQVPYETLLFDDEGHGIRKPNLRILYRRLIEFFDAAFR